MGTFDCHNFQRQGAFVWREIPPTKVDRMLHSMNYIADKEQQVDAESIRTEGSTATKPRSTVSSARPLDPGAAYEADLRSKTGMPIIV